MAISDQIGRLTTLRNNIRTKLIGLGILPAASTSATLSECYSVLSNVTGLGASSYTPTTTTQVIPSGRYLSGPQTINAIPSSYIIPTGTSIITANNTYDIKQYASVSVNVQPALQSKTVTPTQAVQSVTPDAGIYGLSKVTVNAIPSAYIIPSGTSNITANNVYDITQYASVSVNVQPALQSKTVTPTQAVQSVTPDAGVYGLSKVTVNAIPSSYIIPSGTVVLSSSGTFDVTSYASADVTVTGGPSEPYLVFTDYSSESLYLNGSNVIPSEALCFKSAIRLAIYDPNDVLSVGSNAFKGTVFASDYNLPSFPNLKIVGDRGFCGDELNGFVWSSNPVLENVGTYAFGLGVIRFRNIQNINVTFGNLSSIKAGGFANLIENGNSSFYGYDITRYTTSINAGSFTGGALATINGEIRIPLLSEIPNYCFAFGARFASSNLSRLSQKYYFESAMDIGVGAFLGNEAITEFHAPVLSRIYSSCFAYCTKLSVLDCPNVREIGYAAFRMYGATETLYSINRVGVPSVQAITSSLSKIITYLESIPNSFFPSVNILSAFAFQYQRSLKTVSFPNVSILSGSEIFAGCINLESIYLPAFSYTVNNSACFQSCNKLSTVSFPTTSKISGNSMFRSCFNLISLFFLGSSVCALGNTVASMFYSTPVSTYSASAGRWASIFVPSSLLASYKAATNWTTISSKIFAYESYFDANGNPL